MTRAYARAFLVASFVLIDFVNSLAPNSELATKLMALRPGGAVTLIGLGQAQLGEVLSGMSSAPRMLRLDFVGVATTALAIERILDDLADLAATCN
jgi:hypothetical protein